MCLHPINVILFVSNRDTKSGVFSGNHLLLREICEHNCSSRGLSLATDLLTLGPVKLERLHKRGMIHVNVKRLITAQYQNNNFRAAKLVLTYTGTDRKFYFWFKSCNEERRGLFSTGCLVHYTSVFWSSYSHCNKNKHKKQPSSLFDSSGLWNGVSQIVKKDAS